LISLGLTLLFRPSGRALRRRMSEFVSLGQAETRHSGALPNKVFVGAERGLEHARWWSRFKEQVELAEIKMPPVQIALWTIVAVFAVSWLLVQVTGKPVLALGGLIVPYVVWDLISRRV